MRAHTEDQIQKRFLKPREESVLPTASEPWQIVAAGAAVPLGLAVAAAYTSRFSESEKVARTAWICLAIVGSAAVIAAATATRRIHGDPAPRG